MKLKNGKSMCVMLAAAGAWTIGAALAASGPDVSGRPSKALITGERGSLPLSVLGPVARQAPGALPVAGGKPLTAGEFFKNVPALKDVTVDDFMGTMGIMSASLSFCCSECHPGAGTDKVVWEFDTPRKRTARNMVNMVTAINRDNFNGRQVVTCWTCHRGKDFPPVTPSIEDDVYGTPHTDTEDIIARVPGQPTADQLLDKYIAALGGAQKLNSMTSYVMKGMSTGFGGFGGGGDVTIWAKAPNMRTTHIQYKPDTGRGDVTRAFDGATGWFATPLTAVPMYELQGSERDGARLDAQLGFPGQVKTILGNWKVGDITTINDRPVYVVQGSGQKGLLATLYFDKETNLLTRLLRYDASPIGRVPTQVDYAEYREVNGIKMPFKWTFSWLDGRDTVEIKDVQMNQPIDTSVFGRPTLKK